jgi:hypothetical protein
MRGIYGKSEIRKSEIFLHVGLDRFYKAACRGKSVQLRNASHIAARQPESSLPPLHDRLRSTFTGAGAMNADTIAKSRLHNLLEGMTLTALFKALPTFASAALLLRLFGSDLVAHAGGAAIFVVLSSLFYAAVTPYFGPKYPRLFRYSHERLFFDPRLGFTEKFAQWRAQPAASLQLAQNLVLVSVLAVVVLSVR